MIAANYDLEVSARRKIAARPAPCSAGCPGWAVFGDLQSDDPPRIERCDECFRFATSDDQCLLDMEAAALPEARAALERCGTVPVVIDDEGTTVGARSIGDAAPTAIRRVAIALEIEDVPPAAGEVGWWIDRDAPLDSSVDRMLDQWRSTGELGWRSSGHLSAEDATLRAITIRVADIEHDPTDLATRLALRAAHDWIDEHMPRDAESAERARDVLQALTLAIGDRS